MFNSGAPSNEVERNYALEMSEGEDIKKHTLKTTKEESDLGLLVDSIVV